MGEAKDHVLKVLRKWHVFERTARMKATNANYKDSGDFNWDGYYKGRTVASDIDGFAWV